MALTCKKTMATRDVRVPSCLTLSRRYSPVVGQSWAKFKSGRRAANDDGRSSSGFVATSSTMATPLRIRPDACPARLCRRRRQAVATRLCVADPASGLVKGAAIGAHRVRPSAVRPPAGHLCGAVRQLRTPVTCPAPSSSQVSTPPVRAPLASLRDLRPLTRSAPTYIWLVARTTGKCGLAHVRRPAWQASPISCPVAARYTCSSQARAAASSPSIHGTPSRRHQSALKIALCA
jgi:hypothetical protein